METNRSHPDPSRPTQTDTNPTYLLYSRPILVLIKWCVRVHAHAPLVLLKTHTSFHFLWWMRKCSHKHINKNLHPFSSSFIGVVQGFDVPCGPAPPPILSFSLCSSGPTWLSACFPWRLPTSVPRPEAGRWEHSLRHRLSSPDGWGPAAVPTNCGPLRKPLSQAAATVSCISGSGVAWAGGGSTVYRTYAGKKIVSNNSFLSYLPVGWSFLFLSGIIAASTKAANLHKDFRAGGKRGHLCSSTTLATRRCLVSLFSHYFICSLIDLPHLSTPHTHLPTPVSIFMTVWSGFLLFGVKDQNLWPFLTFRLLTADGLQWL